MKKVCIFLVAFLLVSVSSFASPIPDLQSETTDNINPPPPIVGEFPEQSPLEIEARRRPIINPVDLSNASGIYHYVPAKKSDAVEPIPQFPELTNSFQDLGVTTDSTVIGSVNVTDDSNQDVETAIIALEKNGIVYTTTAYFKYLANGDPRIHYSTTTDFVSFTSGQLPRPAGYTWSVDPLLDENWYDTGIAPKRIYLTGLLLDGPPASGNYTGFDYSAIALWRSNNGGYSWTQPTIVSQGTYTTGNVDKPDVAVSWHIGTRGYVYVAYVILKSSNSELWIKRSITDGGGTFTDARLVETGYINGAQVVVSPSSGYVYVIWTDFTRNAIRMSTSYNSGLAWTAPETVPGTGIPGTMLNENNRIKGGMRAGSLPMARFNWVANKVSLVWHECATTCTSTASDTDVYYSSKSPSGWQTTKVKVNDVTTRDQFMPALDFDQTGNMLVTFYDRRDDSSNIKYHLYSAHINSSGSRLEPNIRVSTFQSDPLKYTVYPRFIGDYHDIWSQDQGGVEYYFSSWVGIPPGSGYCSNSPTTPCTVDANCPTGGHCISGDIWMSAIQP